MDNDKTSAQAADNAQVTSCEYRLLKQMQMNGSDSDDLGQARTQDSGGAELNGMGLDDNFSEVVGRPPEANASITVGLGLDYLYKIFGWQR